MNNGNINSNGNNGNGNIWIFKFNEKFFVHELKCSIPSLLDEIINENKYTDFVFHCPFPINQVLVKNVFFEIEKDENEKENTKAELHRILLSIISANFSDDEQVIELGIARRVNIFAIETCIFFCTVFHFKLKTENKEIDRKFPFSLLQIDYMTLVKHIQPLELFKLLNK